MYIYHIIIILLLSLSLSCLFLRNNNIIIMGIGKSIKINEIENKSLLFIFIILLIIATFRDESVGIDMVNYIPRYLVIGSIDWNNLNLYPSSLGFELGFLYVSKIIYFLSSGSTTFFLMITSAVFLFGIYTLTKTYSVAPLLSLSVFICYGIWGNSMNIIRQSMVLGLLCLSLVYMEKKRYYVVAMLVIVSILCHKAALMFIPVLFADNLRLNKNRIIMIYMLFCLFALAPGDIINMIIGSTSYAKYIGRHSSGQTTLIVLIMISFVTTYLRKKISKIDSKINTWLCMLYLAILSNIFALHNGLFARLMQIYLISLLFILPDIVFVFDKNIRSILYVLLSIMMVAYFYLIVMFSYDSSGGILPYSSEILGII